MRGKKKKKLARRVRAKQAGRGPDISRNNIPRFEQLEDRTLLSLLGVGAEIGVPYTDYDAGGTLIYDSVNDTIDEIGRASCRERV